MITTLIARLWMTDRTKILLGVLVDVTQDSITITSNHGEIARWRLDQIDVRHQRDGFHITHHGQEAVLGVTDPGRLASALGLEAVPQPAKGHTKGAEALPRGERSRADSATTLAGASTLSTIHP